ncbi:type II secretion system protein M [Hyphomonadaceae bacterium ML37]|nr:type II secretion system protein M [Hyphomonadaceae bacterium ML37]
MTPATRRMLSVTACAVIVVAALGSAGATAGAWMGTRAALSATEQRAQSAASADPSRFLASGATRAEASAELQDRLAVAARSAGASLTRVRFSAEDAGEPIRISLEVEAEGGLGELARFIHAVEAAPPAVGVTRMRLASSGEGGRLVLTAQVEARRYPQVSP